MANLATSTFLQVKLKDGGRWIVFLMHPNKYHHRQIFQNMVQFKKK